MSKNNDAEPTRQVPRIITGVFAVPLWLVVCAIVLMVTYGFYDDYYRPLHKTRTALRKHFPSWLARVPLEHRAPYEELYSIARSDKHHLATYDAIGVRIMHQLADGRIDAADAQTARALCTAIAQYEDMRMYHRGIQSEPGIREARKKFKELGAAHMGWGSHGKIVGLRND